jgi:hypothetical protein
MREIWVEIVASEATPFFYLLITCLQYQHGCHANLWDTNNTYVIHNKVLIFSRFIDVSKLKMAWKFRDMFWSFNKSSWTIVFVWEHVRILQ